MSAQKTVKIEQAQIIASVFLLWSISKVAANVQTLFRFMSMESVFASLETVLSPKMMEAALSAQNLTTGSPPSSNVCHAMTKAMAPQNSSILKIQPAIAILPILTEFPLEFANPALSLEAGTIISRNASVLPTMCGQTHLKAANALIQIPSNKDTARTVKEVKYGNL